MSRALERLKDVVDVLYHPADIVMVNEGVHYISTPRAPDGAAGMYRALLVRNIVGGTSMVIARKQTLVDSGAFDASLGALEDYALWLRLARANARFHLLTAALTRYHQTTAKASVTQSAAAGLETFARIEDKYRSDFDALPFSARLEHREWMHEIVLLRFRRLKHAAVLAASLFGPRTIIRLRARI